MLHQPSQQENTGIPPVESDREQVQPVVEIGPTSWLGTRQDLLRGIWQEACCKWLCMCFYSEQVLVTSRSKDGRYSCAAFLNCEIDVLTWWKGPEGPNAARVSDPCFIASSLSRCLRHWCRHFWLFVQLGCSWAIWSSALFERSFDFVAWFAVGFSPWMDVGTNDTWQYVEGL